MLTVRGLEEAGDDSVNQFFIYRFVHFKLKLQYSLYITSL